MSGQPILEVENLSRHFAIRSGLFSHQTLKAVDRVSFSVDAGETVGLVGESGCGKSTLGRVVVQLLKPTQGSIRFKGKEIRNPRGKDLHAFRRQMQMVFQDPYASLNPRMTVREIVGEPLRNFGIAKGPDADKRIRKMLEVCGLGAFALDRYPHQFSGGQRQRIGIARALIVEPSFIVADEPISALDVSIQAQIINLFADLRAEFGLTYLFIAHDLAVVRYFSSRVIVMYLGQVVESAPTEQLFSRPIHPYTRVLISSVPLPDPAAERARRPIEVHGEIPSPVNPPSGCRFHTRCPFAQEICSREAPQPVELGNGHRVLCHFAREFAATGQANPTIQERTA